MRVLMVWSVRQLMWFRDVLLGTVLEPLWFILYISELFHIARNYIVGYADDNIVYAVIPIPLSSPQVMESLNKDLAAESMHGGYSVSDHCSRTTQYHSWWY